MQYPLFLSAFNENFNFLHRFSKNPHISKAPVPITEDAKWSPGPVSMEKRKSLAPHQGLNPRLASPYQVAISTTLSQPHNIKTKLNLITTPSTHTSCTVMT
jgi:hypothetical protein